MRRFLWSVPALIVGLLPIGAFGSDQETAQKVAEALRGSGRLQDYSIGVTFENGNAKLLGRVASEEQARKAVEMAKELPYVTKVENRLEIKPSSKRDFAVEPAAHRGGGQTVSRDEALFGPAAPRVPQAAPKVPQIAPTSEVTQAAAAAEPAEPQTLPAEEIAPKAVVRQASAQQAPTTTAQQAAATSQQAPAAAQQANFIGHGRHGHHGRHGPQGGAPIAAGGMVGNGGGMPIPTAIPASSVAQRVAYDQPNMPCYAWPSYAAHPNYAAVTYPNQYSASAWPYIGPFYPYPQVPLGWRRVTMEWKDGWWWLDFNDHCRTFRR